MRDRTLHWLIVGLLLAAAPLSSCRRARQDEWDVPPPTSVRSAVAAPLVAERAGPEVDAVARGLFAKSCATCHGLDGSGQGPSVLDRPARNFKDGGFSFGNTADALFNTISSGIPGTPMPAFAEALAESDRRRLAAYVRTLGPAVDEVDVAETILTVTEESGPRIVRGILPPIVKGAPIRPRGMLVGLPGGLSFEYRIDDVRLLGVRQGGFVERTDWRDRGGTPLKPLGGLIWLDGEGDPPATFALGSRPELARRLVATWGSRLDSELTAEGRRVVLIEEDLRAIERGPLHGFRDELHIPDLPSEPLHVRIARPTPARLVASLEVVTAEPEREKTSWRIFLRPDGVYECVGLVLSTRVEGGLPVLVESDDRMEAVVVADGGSGLKPGGSRIVIERLFSSAWSDSMRRALEEPDR
jgi:mono/diheme cytochrome c family protein